MLSSGRTRNIYASDLVKQLADLREAKFLDDIANSEPINFCIGVGGYPEKHIESPNLKTDIAYLKKKVDNGADYIVTQMFFDNASFHDYVKLCREAGITVPIIPGIKLIDSVRQMNSLAKHFHVTLPDELVDEIHESPKNVKEIGRAWGKKQVEELLNSGVECIHFYVMNDASASVGIIRELT